MPSNRAPGAPQLLTVSGAAELLNVSARTVHNWIKDDRIPYIELPGGMYRIPQHALLSSLRGNYNLADDLEPAPELVAEPVPPSPPPSRPSTGNVRPETSRRYQVAGDR
jgi:excisionase family DNA binding protein